MPFSVLALHTSDELRYLRMGIALTINTLLESALPFKYRHGPKVSPGTMEPAETVAPEGNLCWSGTELG